MTDTCRLVAIVPVAEAVKSFFREWRSERTSGDTVTLSLGFDSEDDAMFRGHALPYVWAVEAVRGPA